MTSVFRTAGAWGAGLGRPLTWVEQDNNTYDKETRITAIEVAGVAVGIDHIVVSGGQMFIYMTDASVQGPFDLPTATWSFTGEWQPSHVYHALDVVTFRGGTYLVNFDHTSATDFDPNETVTGSQEIYTLMWSYAPLPGLEISSATFSPDLQHANNYMRLTYSAGCAVTIDPSVSFPAWTELSFRDTSTVTNSVCTFAATSPAVINPVRGRAMTTDGFGSVVTMKQVSDTGVWDIFGHLAGV